MTLCHEAIQESVHEPWIAASLRYASLLAKTNSFFTECRWEFWYTTGMSRFASVNIIAGDAGIIDALMREIEKEISFDVSDLWVRRFGGMGVDDARELRDRAQLRAVAGGSRVFILAATSITNEAQNALLKTLEEPAGDSFFFIIIPSPQTLLPTVRSRARMVSFEGVATHSTVDVAKFLASTPAQRIDMLKPLLEKGDDDKRDTGAIVVFLIELERTLAQRAASPSAREGLRAIYRARQFLGDKGALVKPLLEQVALLV